LDKSLLISCAACGSELSLKASRCQTCGHPNARVSRQSIAVVGVALAVVVTLLAWRIHTSNARLAQSELALVSRAVEEYRSLPEDAPSPVRCGHAELVVRFASQYQPSLVPEWERIAAEDCQSPSATVGI